MSLWENPFALLKTVRKHRVWHRSRNTHSRWPTPSTRGRGSHMTQPLRVRRIGSHSVGVLQRGLRLRNSDRSAQ